MISICYSGNQRIFEGIMLSALSVMRQTQEPLRFWILTMDLTDSNPLFEAIDRNSALALETAAKKHHPDNDVRLIDVTELYHRLLHGRNSRISYTPYCLLRLLLDRIEGIPEKLIYLDADTMATGDIAELYRQNVDGFQYGAVRDHMGRFWINPRYVNSGVLLLNMGEIRRTGLFERARRMVCRRKMIMADQTALNKYARKKLFLPRRFNEQRAIRSNTVVKHFCKGIRFYPFFFYIYNIKQWERDAVHNKLKIHCFDEVYEEYDRIAQEFGLTSYADYRPGERRRRRRCDCCGPVTAE